ncbi:MAG: DUF2384 domain-containing protein [Afipia sp.]|jgi:hypothetical protein|nr:DUF2384 domain-containing protein [Afipia sp.]
MTTRHTGQARRSNVASRVATTVRDALKSEPRLKRSAVALSARIAGTAAAAVADLPEEARATLTRREPELITRIRGLVEAFGETARPAHIALDFGREVEPRKGAGVGTVVSEAEGDAALHELAVARRLEDWAGEVAGASALLRDYGIARSSLHRWQQNGDVIALLKGAKKHVFPVDQFIDSRPAKGISDVMAIITDPRVAWLWLSRANPVLGGRKPIDLLKRDRVSEVVEAARDYFTQP